MRYQRVASLKTAEDFRAYLAAFLFVLGVPLGSLGLLLLHTLTRGDWGGNARGFYALTARTLPLVALLFLTVWLLRRRSKHRRR